MNEQITTAHPFLDAISYQRALSRVFSDERTIDGLAEMVHLHKGALGWFPVTLPSYVLVALVDKVLKDVLAAERRKLLMFGLEAEKQNKAREAGR
jgi:hypothetical protein